LVVRVVEEAEMMREGLFEDLPEQVSPKEAEPLGPPRLREPVRDQLELRCVDLESLIGEDHPARLFWVYAEQVDLRELEDAIKAREGHPGHPTITPRLMLALWLYAYSQGVGSARALDRLCKSHDGYRWLCGGVSVNYHTLSEFRVGQGDLLEKLLILHLAALAAAGLVDFTTLIQDGIRIRAAAGSASFRRRATLEQLEAAARELVEHLRGELNEDAEASNRRIRAARERAARERAERLAAALKAQSAVEEQRKRREKKNANQTKEQKEPRTSTTDPQARVMKMPDGGFRPAWNVQVVTAGEEQIVVAVEPTSVGSDRGLMRPMLEAIRERLGRLPERYLADGGFMAGPDIEWAHESGVDVYCQPTRSKHGGDPYAPRKTDGPGVRAWRERMASEEGQDVYKRRGIGECVHARWRNWNLDQLTVRGAPKVKNVMLWYALANNILQGHRLHLQRLATA
jgi:transposase